MPELDLNGRRIAYRASGAGPPVILLHCSSSHSGQWKPYIEAWSHRYRLLAPDLHGYGRSDPLPDDQPCFVHDRQILPALMEAEGAVGAHVVGHSFGGLVAFFAARQTPARIRSLTMIEPVLVSLLDETGDPEMGERPVITERIDRLVTEGRAEDASRYFVDFWSGEGTWDATPPELRDYIRATIGRVRSDWLSGRPDLPGQARLADCARLAMPVEIWRGTATRASARAIAGHLAAAIPGARLREVAGAGHMAAALEPDRFIEPIGNFLDRVAVGEDAQTREI